MVYSEVGKFPLQLTIDKHMINYWIRLINKDSTSYASIIYRITLKLFISGEYKTQWLSRVKSIIVLYLVERKIVLIKINANL